MALSKCLKLVTDNDANSRTAIIDKNLQYFGFHIIKDISIKCRNVQNVENNDTRLYV